MFTHKTGIPYQKLLDKSRIRNVINPESKVKTLNSKLFVRVDGLSLESGQSTFTQDGVCTDLVPR